MLGAYAVGKTSLVRQYVYSIFGGRYQSTIGVKIDSKQMQIDGQQIELILWDLAGEEESINVRSSYLRGSAGAVLVADGTRGETLDVATRRRLRDELNFETTLEHVYHFEYTAAFGDAGSENELCHVYLGKTTDQLRPNDNEIAAIRFVGADVLGQELSRRPELFTPWFRQEWADLTTRFGAQLTRYCKLS